MTHEDIAETIAALNASIANAERVAAKCREMIHELYTVPVDPAELSLSKDYRRRFPWERLENPRDEFFFPCNDEERGRVRNSLAATAIKKFGAGRIKVKAVDGGYYAIMK